MKNSQGYSRRDFVKHSTIAGAAIIIPSIHLKSRSLTSKVEDDQINISIFSKQLQFLDYKGMSEAAKEMGFDGIDLTIRPKGHVLPESVLDDLPLATEAMSSFGLLPNLFSTSINDASDPIHNRVLETASQQGYQKYRTAWFKYKQDKPILDTVNYAGNQLRKLATLNKKLNLTGGYQNHSGRYFGSAIWDLHQVIREISPNEIGSQYDIMHATVEGGKNWEIGFNLIMPYINSIVLKDFVWAKKDGKWKVQYVPLGEGMVNFKKFFALLKENKINVPFSIHVEYDLGGAEHGLTPTIKHQEIFKSIQKDLEFTRRTYQES